MSEDDPLVLRSEAVRVAWRVTRVCMFVALALGWLAGFFTGVSW